LFKVFSLAKVINYLKRNKIPAKIKV
jgi:hypothetical protein